MFDKYLDRLNKDHERDDSDLRGAGAGKSKLEEKIGTAIFLRVGFSVFFP